MLKEIFGFDKSFMELMEGVAHLMLLSVLWLLCSLPVVTLATSTAALYYAVTKSVRKGHGYPVAEFLSYFKENWKQGIWLSVCYELLAGAVFLNLWCASLLKEQAGHHQIFFIVALWVLFLLVCLSLYVFPIFSRFCYSTKDTLKTALLMSLRHVISSLCMGVLLVFFVLVCAKYLVLLLFVPAFFELLLSFRMEAVFRKYMDRPKEGEEIPWYWEGYVEIGQNDVK